MRVIGELDSTHAWDGARLLTEADLGPDRDPPIVLRGAAGSVEGNGERRRIVRDPLGIDKLFWALGADGLAVAARPARLIREGFSLEDVSAVPRGAVLDADSSGVRERARLSLDGAEPIMDVGRAGSSIRAALDGYLSALASANRGADVFVCLSGGLDSSGIASLVAEHFPGATGVSFDIAGRAPSADRAAGRRVARELGLPLLEADVSEPELLEHLDLVLVEGVDWRDFNVHAGLVNAVLAEAIAGTGGRFARSLVFTGDLANEFLVDYAAERYEGETYYELPRLSQRMLRASLVRGLDTSHREVGVFEAFGIPVVQPYAVAVDTYLGLPEEFLLLPDRKERLCRAIFGERLPRFVYERPKARAQTGGAEGAGVLGASLRHGIDADWLRSRFAELHGVEDLSVLDRFVRAGLYRSALPAQAQQAV
jgi:asparagine synthetase B (glutamine-hydrolysing)